MVRLVVFAILFSTAVGAQDQMRLFTHVPPARGYFDTWVYLSNTNAQEQTFRLLPYDESGQQLESFEGQLAAGETWRAKSSAFFQVGTSHFFVEGAISVELLYNSPFEASLQTRVGQTETVGQAFLLFPGDWARQFDGLAVVNPGETEAVVRVAFDNFQNQSMALPTRLNREWVVPPKGKTLVTLGSPADRTVVDSSQLRIKISSNQPIAVLGLSGAYREGRLVSLWPSLVTALPENND